jgi:hypothetical protein
MWEGRVHLSNWVILLVRFQNHDGGVHFPLWIFFARTIDRFEGLRTGARDIMLSDEATRTKGKNIRFSSFHGYTGLY